MVKNQKMHIGGKQLLKRLGKPQIKTKFFDYIWKGWLNLAIYFINTGTDRGLPISCFGIDVGILFRDWY